MINGTVGRVCPWKRVQLKFGKYHQSQYVNVHSENVYSRTPVKLDTSTKMCEVQQWVSMDMVTVKMYSKARVIADTCALQICTVHSSQRRQVYNRIL